MKINKHKNDPWLVGSVTVLLTIGLIMVFSASAVLAQENSAVVPVILKNADFSTKKNRSPQTGFLVVLDPIADRNTHICFLFFRVPGQPGSVKDPVLFYGNSLPVQEKHLFGLQMGDLSFKRLVAIQEYLCIVEILTRKISEYQEALQVHPCFPFVYNTLVSNQPVNVR